MCMVFSMPYVVQILDLNAVFALQVQLSCTTSVYADILVFLVKL